MIDPLEDLFTQDNHKDVNENSQLLQSPERKTINHNINTIQESTINHDDTTYKEGYKYDYDYTILLNYPNEDGLMDTYLTGNLFNNISESNNENDKPRVNPSDWFNFGLDEEKWIKFLNKSILMHYERHLIQQAAAAEINKPTPYPTQQPVRPVAPMPMPNFPQYPYALYRPGFMPFPGYQFPNPSHPPFQPQGEDRNK